ncbi:MAG: DUF58 domain-containing protein [Planctomycetes bacterium]|nr:DUF58 domain-containing protein [Planctomycetota bacterium]
MRAELELAVRRFALSVPRRALTGRIGERLGRGLGASVEFEDHRDYQPGDDPRHVDWRVFARTDRIAVRLYREEVAPLLDVVIDRSPQLAVTAAKEQAARDLVAALCHWGVRDGGAAQCHASGGEVFDPARGFAFTDRFDGFAPRRRLRRGGLRALISDLLRPADPMRSLAPLAEGAAHLFVVQVLDDWELEPAREGPRTLLAADADERADLALDERTIAAYRARLARLVDDVGDAVRRFGGTHAVVRAAAPGVMFAGDLLRAGMVEPA